MNFNIPKAVFLANDGVTVLEADDPNVAIVQRGNLRTYPKAGFRREVKYPNGSWVELKAAPQTPSIKT